MAISGNYAATAGSVCQVTSDNTSTTWSQTSGPTVTLSGSGAVRWFTPTAAGSYVFTASTGGTTTVTVTAVSTLDVTLLIDWFTSSTTWASYSSVAATLTGNGQDVVLKAAVPDGVTCWKPNLAVGAAAGATPSDVVSVRSFSAVVSATKTTTPPVVDTGSGATGVYYTSGKNIVGPDGKTFMPKGFNVGGWNANGGPSNDISQNTAVMDYWKTIGVNTIRLTMNPTSLKPWGWLAANYSWGGKTGLAGLAQYCTDMVAIYRARGFVTLLEFHDFTDGGQTETHLQQAEQAWTLLANTFKSQSDVWFNTANEPAVQGSAWTEFQRRMTKAIRDTGAKNIIVYDCPVGGTDGSSQGKARDLLGPVKTAYPGNQVISQHNYGWSQDGSDLTNETQYRAWAQANFDAGFPVMHGEIGHQTPATANTPANLAGCLRALTTGKELGIGSLWWATNFNDTFKINADGSDPLPSNANAAKTTGGAAFMSFLAAATTGTTVTPPATGGTGGTGGTGTTTPTPVSGSLWVKASTTGVEPGGFLMRGNITTSDTLPASLIGSQNTQDAGVRDACMMPGLALAPVNVPLVDGCQTVDAPELRDSSLSVFFNYKSYGHSALFDPSTQPTVLVKDNGSWHLDFDVAGQPQVQRNWHILPYRPAAAGTDGNLQVMNVQSDGTVKMIEAYKASWASSSLVNSERVKVADLSGMMTGPNNGIRAFDGPCVTGLIREHEVNKSHPLYRADPVRTDAPLIPHALAVSLDMYKQLGPRSNGWWNIYGTHGTVDQNAHPGWDAGTADRFWFNTATGAHQYPASSSDSFSYGGSQYGGSIKMGTLLCIPSNVDIMAMGLSAQGFAIARALQDYGAYVEDANNGGVAFYLEYNGPKSDNGPAAWFMNFGWPPAELLKIVAQLRRVVLNTQKYPAGGALTAKRRKPFAAPLAYVDPARPYLDPTRSYLVTGS